MSAEELHRASAAIRDEWGADRGGAWSQVQSFHLAVADWLESEATKWDGDFEEYHDRHLNAFGGDPSAEYRDHVALISVEYADGQHRRALAVARTYLGVQQ